MPERRLITDFWTLTLGDSSRIQKTLIELYSFLQDSGLLETENAKTRYITEDSDKADLPSYFAKGLRLICWLKLSEAHLILNAYDNESSKELKDSVGKVLAGARWHDKNDPKLDMFNTNANVQFVRYRGGVERRVGWIYKQEAESAITVTTTQQTKDILVDGVLVGAVVFFPNSSPESQMYKSNVCLLRKRGYRYGTKIR